MSRIRKIISIYLSYRQPRSTRKEFAEWFAAPFDGETKQDVYKRQVRVHSVPSVYVSGESNLRFTAAILSVSLRTSLNENCLLYTSRCV